MIWRKFSSDTCIGCGCADWWYRESLQYVLESVPIVDRAFVHVDYASYNLPTHMQQQAR